MLRGIRRSEVLSEEMCQTRLNCRGRSPIFAIAIDLRKNLA
jgi:hypothetical protein